MAWKKIATIKKSDKGSTYMKIEEDVTLKKGDTLNIYDPRKSKFMTPERLAKLPDYVKAEVFQGPPRDKTD